VLDQWDLDEWRTLFVSEMSGMNVGWRRSAGD